MQYQITRRFMRTLRAPPTPCPCLPPHGTTLLSLVRLSIDTRVRVPRKHARFFGSPARDAPSPAQFDSPVQYDSPVGLYECDGWCKPWDGCGRAAGAVVSLSSCSDLQQSWESDVGSMTTMLCEFLEKHKTGAPSYREVMSHVNFELHKVARQLHAWTRAGKKEKNPCAAEGEMRSFQTPELSSLVKLDMEAPFRLGLQDEARAG
ncbi:hypothetical protein EWM64_g5895 [Hericium alpestre]|uniref:Uncharacterized protein n=1 Tax=Hericium alpestre TaxID=135208 RepID=A0A4Y9ZXA5_9AGAM|nr:hypothetical protein EWM64_g5895 [Hericium alpestre]